VFVFAVCSTLTLLMLGSGVYLWKGMSSRLSAAALDYYNCQFDRAFTNEITLQQAVAGKFAELGARNTNDPIQIVLWGDSHAMSVAPALDELCRRFSVRGVEATHSATAPILGNFEYERYGLGEESLAFSKSVVEFISEKHIKTVVIAANWNRYSPPNLVNLKLAATMHAVIASGARVYLLKDVPEADFDVPRRAAMTVRYHGNLARLAISPDKYRATNNDFDTIFDNMAKIGAVVLDTPSYFLNADGQYDVIRDNRALYCDSNHLSVKGAELLIPMFEPLFSRN
jgi:hypothetical protein